MTMPALRDFEFRIDFVRGEGSASRVLLAANDFVQACERLDRELVKSVHSGIEATVVLDDIQSGSIRLLLRTILSSVDDEAIKHLDWKLLIGGFLLKAKEKVLRWADSPQAPQKLPQLRKELLEEAIKTDVLQIAGYVPPSAAVLIRAIEDIQGVKNRLLPGDHAIYTFSGGSHEIDQSVMWSPDEIERLAVKETIHQASLQMILAVKRPDYLGSSKWDLRHGKRAISATIADQGWLERFQRRIEEVRPGDAIKCKVDIEMLYGYDNELLAEHYSVTEVIEVLREQVHQGDWLRD